MLIQQDREMFREEEVSKAFEVKISNQIVVLQEFSPFQLTIYQYQYVFVLVHLMYLVNRQQTHKQLHSRSPFVKLEKIFDLNHLVHCFQRIRRVELCQHRLLFEQDDQMHHFQLDLLERFVKLFSIFQLTRSIDQYK